MWKKEKPKYMTVSNKNEIVHTGTVENFLAIKRKTAKTRDGCAFFVI